MFPRDEMIELIQDAIHGNVCDEVEECSHRLDYRDDAVAVVQALEDKGFTIIRNSEMHRL